MQTRIDTHSLWTRSRKAECLGEAHQGLEVREALVDDPASLDRAISGADAVINCAGPFIDTAIPVIEAALRSGIHYLDVAAEQAAVLAAFKQFANVARDAGIVVAPAMAFYGGLGDLLATAAMGEWVAADEIAIAIALDSWRPTQGTRLTALEILVGVSSFRRINWSTDPPPRAWNFPAPFGPLDVEGLPSLKPSLFHTISTHLRFAHI